MKQRVVFLSYHGFGHINACLKLARILEEKYQVYFAGVKYFQNYVSSQGLSYYLLKSGPFGLGLETWVNTIENNKPVFFSSLRDRITDRLYKAREVNLYWMLEELKPDIVFIDALQATDFIVLYPQLKNRNIKAAVIHTMLPTHVFPGHPPLNSGVFPNSKDDTKAAIRQMKWQRFKKVWMKKITSFGFDEQFLIRRRLKKNSIPQHYISKTPGLLNFALQHVDEFILAPREFDFPDFTLNPTQHYVGFMTDENRNDQQDPSYQNDARHIYALKRNKNLKLIYCSFGTIALKEKKILISFLQKLIQVAVTENFLLLISLKAQAEDIYKLKTSENIYIFNSVPQLEVLSYADLFITHGGLNSIKEAIFAEVPMLMYPIHTDYDPKGNSARIVFHGLGLRGNPVADSENQIKEKIKDLLSNPLYKRKVQELKHKDALYTAEQFLEWLKGIKHF